MKLFDDLVLDARLTAELSERSKPLSTNLASIGTTEGRERLAAYLASRPFPHFEAVPDHPGVLVKIDEDGTRTLGRFVQRVFRPVGR